MAIIDYLGIEQAIKTLLNNDCIKVLNSNRPNIIGLKKITSETPKIKKMYLKRINELKK